MGKCYNNTNQYVTEDIQVALQFSFDKNECPFFDKIDMLFPPKTIDYGYSSTSL